MAGGELITVDQVAELLKVKKATVYAWTHQDRIPHVKVGRLVRFRRDAIEAWLGKREVKGRAGRIPEVTPAAPQKNCGNGRGEE